MIGPVTGTISPRITMNNSAYNWMNSGAALISMAGNPSAMSPNALRTNENRLKLMMINDSLMYKVAELQDESSKKLVKDNIKRTFNVFA